jgi:hypothetical protein
VHELPQTKARCRHTTLHAYYCLLLLLLLLMTSGKNFTEGWVEFEDKAVAKSVARGLNGQQIGGKRRSAYHFDLWCMKYLPKFKWDHLTEEIAYEKVSLW